MLCILWSSNSIKGDNCNTSNCFDSLLSLCIKKGGGACTFFNMVAIFLQKQILCWLSASDISAVMTKEKSPPPITISYHLISADSIPLVFHIKLDDWYYYSVCRHHLHKYVQVHYEENWLKKEKALNICHLLLTAELLLCPEPSAPVEAHEDWRCLNAFQGPPLQNQINVKLPPLKHVHFYIIWRLRHSKITSKVRADMSWISAFGIFMCHKSKKVVHTVWSEFTSFWVLICKYRMNSLHTL